jgi:tRNA (guanine37-N1)-methyltransferase
MRFDLITLFPHMFDALKTGITGRALEKNLITLHTHNPRDFTHNKQKRVDDHSYGGGPGMVMQYQPLHDAITHARNAAPEKPDVIYLSPQGTPLSQAILRELSQKKRFILIAGRYEGIDERVIQQDVDAEYSIGDYVLSGGELAAMVLIDGITRLLPGALGDENSAAQDSFENDLLDHPHYSRPEVIDGLSVPKVLQSGDHEAIFRWRLQQSLGKTWQKRPDLLKRRILSKDEQKLLQLYIDDLLGNGHEQTHSSD